MRIAIVDDAAEDLSQGIDFLKTYISKNYPDLEIKLEPFEDPEKFLDEFERGKFDLILLDIIMETMNGIQAAQRIREIDRDCSIIFVTSSEDFLIDGYSVFAIGYFLKPIQDHEGDLKRTFEFILPKILEKNRTLKVMAIGNLKLDIPFKEILLVDISPNHKVRIVTVNQEIFTTMNYRDCQEILLQDQRFLECHYRIIINMDRVQSMKSEDFILSNGIKVPMSQRYRRESKLAYMNYLLHKND